MTVRYDVLFDYDDVIYPCSPMMQKMADETGLSKGRRITQWLAHEDFGCTAEELWGMLHADKDRFYGQPPYRDVIAQMRRLRYAGHRIHIVTARGTADGHFYGIESEEIQALTRRQILREGVPFDSISFLKDKTQFPADFAIDDGIHNYVQLNAAGVQVYLMNAMHNQGFLARRVYAVEQFADIVIGMAELGIRAA